MSPKEGTILNINGTNWEQGEHVLIKMGYFGRPANQPGQIFFNKTNVTGSTRIYILSNDDNLDGAKPAGNYKSIIKTKYRYSWLIEQHNIDRAIKKEDALKTLKEQNNEIDLQTLKNSY